jgi:hypothetical protein
MPSQNQAISKSSSESHQRPQKKHQIESKIHKSEMDLRTMLAQKIKIMIKPKPRILLLKAKFDELEVKSNRSTRRLSPKSWPISD